jgi:excisionase family DNA binding protein
VRNRSKDQGITIMAHNRDDRRGKASLERADAFTQRPLAMLTLGELLQAMRELIRAELAPAHEPQAPARQSESEPPPKFLTPQEAAEHCGVSEKTVRTWVQRGKLPASRAGRLLRIDRRDIEDYLTSGNGAPSSNRLDADALASNILFRRKAK